MTSYTNKHELYHIWRDPYHHTSDANVTAQDGAVQVLPIVLDSVGGTDSGHAFACYVNLTLDDVQVRAWAGDGEGKGEAEFDGDGSRVNVREWEWEVVGASHDNEALVLNALLVQNAKVLLVLFQVWVFVPRTTSYHI